MGKTLKKDNKDLNQILADIEKQFGKGSIMCLGEDSHIKIDVVSSTWGRWLSERTNN